MINKKGQVTIFIIIAIVLVAAVGLFFTFKDTFGQKSLPANIEPIYTSFLSCVEENTLAGISVLESQAGYIELPEFEPGSRYMPFSSELDFLGNPVPYWYYVSGNNIQKEQVPSKKEMANQLEKFIEAEMNDCVFDQYYGQGFRIEQGEAEARAVIRENKVDVNIDMRMSIERETESVLIREHDVSVDSKLGKLYNSAKKIYEQEQDELFLEEYAVDFLRLYAPVDGVELGCSPKVWNADEVFNDLENAIEANTLALRAKGGDEYFVKDLNVDLGVGVRFINSRDWPNGFEVQPSEGSFLMADPVGNQPGLGVLGFCYMPYHFVYNVRYPVLVQIYEDDETFQYPIAVVLQGNKPRESLQGSAAIAQGFGLCENKNTPIQVKTYDTELNPVNADISYECFGEICEIGKSPLEEAFPQCVNGNIIARAMGFEEARYMYSTTEAGNVEIIMDRLYTLPVMLKLDATSYDGNAMIHFVSDKGSKTVVYPDQKTVGLSEGEYEVQVYIYKNSALNLQATTVEQCVEVPRSGIAGVFGLRKDKCFDVDIPAQIISNVLSGGGKQTHYILESELRDSGFIEINAQGLKLPETLEDLQNNYILFEDKGLDITFK